MSLEYACFISYRHMASPGAIALVDEIHQRLCEQIEMELGGRAKTYYDKSRLNGGDYFTPALARALCQSSCMIMLYIPGYFDERSTFCSREYRAMVGLEVQRKAALGDALGDMSLVIPVVLRGRDTLPHEVVQRQVVMLEQESTHVQRLRGVRAADKFRELAKLVARRHDLQTSVAPELIEPCAGFKLPADDDPGVAEVIGQATAIRTAPMLPIGRRT